MHFHSTTEIWTLFTQWRNLNSSKVEKLFHKGTQNGGQKFVVHRAECCFPVYFDEQLSDKNFHYINNLNHLFTTVINREQLYLCVIAAAVMLLFTTHNQFYRLVHAFTLGFHFPRMQLIFFFGSSVWLINEYFNIKSKWEPARKWSFIAMLSHREIYVLFRLYVHPSHYQFIHICRILFKMHFRLYSM